MCIVANVNNSQGFHYNDLIASTSVCQYGRFDKPLGVLFIIMSHTCDSVYSMVANNIPGERPPGCIKSSQF